MNKNDFPKFNPDSSPVLTHGEAVARYMAGTLDAKTKKELDRVLAISQTAFGSALEGLRQAQMNALEELHSRIDEMLAPAIGRYANWLLQLDEPLREALLVLSENGWFLCTKLPFEAIWELRDAFENGDTEDAENALMDYFEEQLDEIEESAVGKFPARRKILEAAFNAHRRGEFELSIPVLLAQSDGISKELFNGYLFKSKNKLPETAAFVQTLEGDTFTKNLLLPLTIKSPINRSANERSKDFEGLNRHQVLHGDSVEYGTRRNALKAVSLLNYVATVFSPTNEAV